QGLPRNSSAVAGEITVRHDRSQPGALADESVAHSGESACEAVLEKSLHLLLAIPGCAASPATVRGVGASHGYRRAVRMRGRCDVCRSRLRAHAQARPEELVQAHPRRSRVCLKFAAGTRLPRSRLPSHSKIPDARALLVRL